MTEQAERLRLAIVLYLRHGVGLHWTPVTAWKMAGQFMEFRQFCREHKIRREGMWLVGYGDQP